MKRAAILVLMSVGLASFTACTPEDAAESISGESDLTKKTEVLADIQIAGVLDSSWNTPDSASAKLRAYRFHATPEDIVDIVMDGPGELSLLDAKGAAISKGALSDDGREVAIGTQKFAAEGDYLIAFRNPDAEKDNRPTIHLTRNYSQATISTFDCSTDEDFVDGKKEGFSFDIAYLADAARRSILNVPPEKDPDEYGLMVVPADPDGHSMLLNENISAYFDKGTFSIHGDGDGIELIDLVLYEDSGFKRGYLRASREVEAYSKVTCTIKEAKGRADLK